MNSKRHKASSGGMKVCYQISLLALFVFFVPLVPTYAQSNSDAPVSVVYVHGNGDVELNGVKSGSITHFEELLTRLKQKFVDDDKSIKSSPGSGNRMSSCYTRPVIIRADENLKYGEFADLIVSVREAGADPIKVSATQFGQDAFLAVPHDSCPDQDLSLLKPNPLTLVVRITSDQRLFLNNEPQGTTADLSALENKLSEVFDNRLKQRIFRRGSTEIEKTLFIDASRSLNVGQVMTIASVLRISGAEPLGLKIDDLPK